MELHSLFQIKDIEDALRIHLENVVLILIIILFALLCLFQEFDIFTFQVGRDVSNIFGNILQSLASVFAIVFSISLVAIQLCSENLSHRLIGLYVKNRNFLFPICLNFVVVLFDLALVSDERLASLASYGVIYNIIAIASLILFFIFTIRFLRPVPVTRKLLRRVEINVLSSEDSSIRECIYREIFQPIDDIVSSCAKKGDYATVKDLIDLIVKKMYELFALGEKKMKKEEGGVPILRLLVFTSRPFARLFQGIAVSANKNDAMEITFHVIRTIGSFVKQFPDARFVPAYKIFEEAIERIHSQAKYRFGTDEYKTDLALLEIEIASARVSFSEFVK